jgi:hypothetical protein
VIVPTYGEGGREEGEGGRDCGWEAELVVVDVNFFPSFKEVEDFPARLRAFLRERAGGRRGGDIRRGREGGREGGREESKERHCPQRPGVREAERGEREGSEQM